MQKDLVLKRNYISNLSSLHAKGIQVWGLVLRSCWGGGVGAHKFYLKRNTSGIIYALCGTIGWVIIVPPIVIAILCIVDAFQMEGTVVKFNNELGREIKLEIETIR